MKHIDKPTRDQISAFVTDEVAPEVASGEAFAAELLIKDDRHTVAVSVHCIDPVELSVEWHWLDGEDAIVDVEALWTATDGDLEKHGPLVVAIEKMLQAGNEIVGLAAAAAA